MNLFAVGGHHRIILGLAAISVASFIVGMSLLGASSASGYFYVASLIAGAPVLLRLDYRPLIVPTVVPLYLGALGAFTVLCLAHVAFGEASISILDYVARLWIGVVNGFAMLAFLRFDRQRLFNFIGIVAACHAAVAFAVAIGQGVDFSDLWFSGERAGGMTNPIPFSNMLFASTGLAAIAFAGRRRTAADLGLVALLLMLGCFGVLLTATRGTLLAAPLLVLLLVWSYRSQFSRRTFATAAAGVFVVSFVGMVAILQFSDASLAELFARAGSDQLRLELLTLSISLIGYAPFLGHGLDSVPSVFLEFGLVDRSETMLFTFNHMHNQYLDMMVKTGFVGTAIFLAPALVGLGAAARLVTVPEQRHFALAIIWVIGAYGVFGLTNPYFSHANTTLQFGVYLGMLIWLAPPNRVDPDRATPESGSAIPSD